MQRGRRIANIEQGNAKDEGSRKKVTGFGQRKCEKEEGVIYYEDMGRILLRRGKLQRRWCDFSCGGQALCSYKMSKLEARSTLSFDPLRGREEKEGGGDTIFDFGLPISDWRGREERMGGQAEGVMYYAPTGRGASGTQFPWKISESLSK